MRKPSLWQDTVTLRRFPALESDVEVDVLIVGGGITGITTAVLLKEAGLKVAVVDKGRIGGGETGHTTAHLTYVTDLRLRELLAKHGRERAAMFWQAHEAAIRQIERLVNTREITCGFGHVPGHLIATPGKDPDEETRSLREDAQIARGLGFDAQYLEADPLFGRPAVRFANQAKFHPLRYLGTLAESIPGDGSHVFEETSGSDTEAGEHLLRAGSGSIRYECLVSATHAPIQGERNALSASLLQTKLAAYSTYAIEAGIDRVPDSLFWDTSDPYSYLRFDNSGDDCALILGGSDHKTGVEQQTGRCFSDLENLLQKLFPGAKPRRRWSGQVLETPDGLPYIGRVGERQFVATGYSGNGMTHGTLAGMLLRDLIAGRQNPWADLFAPDRKPLAGAWDYLRENMDFPAHFVADRFEPPDSPDGLLAGEGRILRVDGERKAVYCNEYGERILLSPVCPHMGCIVKWNAAEKTWDCPCHGSRFEATGELIAGPAESGLSRT